jgi:hypothetical protein
LGAQRQHSAKGKSRARDLDRADETCAIALPGFLQGERFLAFARHTNKNTVWVWNDVKNLSEGTIPAPLGDFGGFFK